MIGYEIGERRVFEPLAAFPSHLMFAATPTTVKRKQAFSSGVAWLSLTILPVKRALVGKSGVRQVLEFLARGVVGKEKNPGICKIS